MVKESIFQLSLNEKNQSELWLKNQFYYTLGFSKCIWPLLTEHLLDLIIKPSAESIAQGMNSVAQAVTSGELRKTCTCEADTEVRI